MMTMGFTPAVISFWENAKVEEGCGSKGGSSGGR